MLEERVGNIFICNCDILLSFHRVLYILWQPCNGGNDYLFFLIGDVAAVFVDDASGVQDCMLRKYT